MKILFLCVANSARSQMAEGIARHLFGDKAEVMSAGSQPKSLNPLAVQSLKEIDIDISKHESKSVDTIDIKSVDLIITLCADEICPYVAGNQQRQHWPFPDPANPSLSLAQQKEQFAQVRDNLVEQIRGLGKNLGLIPHFRPQRG